MSKHRLSRVTNIFFGGYGCRRAKGRRAGTQIDQEYLGVLLTGERDRGLGRDPCAIALGQDDVVQGSEAVQDVEPGAAGSAGRRLR